MGKKRGVWKKKTSQEGGVANRQEDRAYVRGGRCRRPSFREKEAISKEEVRWGKMKEK